MTTSKSTFKRLTAQQGDVEGKAQRISVECLECGKEFKTISMLPSCPKCGGSDIDLSDPCPGWSSK